MSSPAMTRPMMVLKSVCIGLGLGVIIISLVRVFTHVKTPEEHLQFLFKLSTPSVRSARAVDSNAVDWSTVLGKKKNEDILSRISREVPSNLRVTPPPYDPTRPVNYSLVTITPEMISTCGEEDLMCKKYLLPVTDLEYYKNCLGKVKESNYTVSPTPSCRLMNGARRGAVALVSLPGSGNTWVRGLLEQATGICTGTTQELRLHDCTTFV